MKQPQGAQSDGPVVNWPMIFCVFTSLPLELVLHDFRTFGVRSVGPRVGGAALVMFVFLSCHPHDNCRPLGFFMIGIIALSIIAHVIAMIRSWRGEHTLSRYNGTPYAAWCFPRYEVGIKRIEPIVALAIAWGIHHFNHPLGAFLMTASFCHGFRVGLDHMARRERELDINDAVREQTIAMENSHGYPQR